MKDQSWKLLKVFLLLKKKNPLSKIWLIQLLGHVWSQKWITSSFVNSWLNIPISYTHVHNPSANLPHLQRWDTLEKRRLRLCPFCIAQLAGLLRIAHEIPELAALFRSTMHFVPSLHLQPLNINFAQYSFHPQCQQQRGWPTGQNLIIKGTPNCKEGWETVFNGGGWGGICLVGIQGLITKRSEKWILAFLLWHYLEKNVLNKRKVIRPKEGKFRKLQVGNLISALSRLKITLSGWCVCLPDSSLIAKMDIAGYQNLNFKSYSWFPLFCCHAHWEIFPPPKGEYVLFKRPRQTLVSLMIMFLNGWIY